MVAAVLWVQRTGARWRDLPPSFGPWETAYGRFNRWRAAGLWAHLVHALEPPGG